ncbi:MAG: EAL domain-containing protein, partial [Sulfurimonas sp.]|nr:EAL domain-containing protein [Sulfurimonas sp.]
MAFSKSEITSIMSCGSYGVSYEPIKETVSLETIGYEALSRFKLKEKMVSPDVFFKVVHEDIDLFFYIESTLKKFQLEHRVQDKKLFLNLDPDVSITETQIEFWVELLHNSSNIVIEIIENSDEESVEDIEHFMEWLEMYKLPFAYDDFGKPNTLFFASLMHKANYLKLDIYYIRSIRENPVYIELLKGVVNFAKLNNQYTILEGVETQADLKVAQDLGIDCVQGYLF